MSGLGINLPGLVTQLVGFLILFAVLYKLLYGPITRALDDRSTKIRESLEAADRAQEQAASSADRVEEELNEARQQGQVLIAEARDAAANFRQQEEARTRSDMEDLLERARAEIERERDAAVEEVRQEFAGLAISAAERVVERSLDADAHSELIDRVLEEGLSERSN